MTYECEICKGINHVKRLHCQNCGVTPRSYSIIQKPVVIHIPASMDDCSFGRYTEACRANGAVSQRSSHARVVFRTVPADYYAEL